MVFSSLPLHLDPPNWHQQPQQNQQPGGSGGDQSNILIPHELEAPGPGSRTPGSMTERARLAKLPQSETALKCPRCESTNTKFCYFNNYNLSQPRHFCKACRRYWTRGGALRSVPVGGGCRRNNKRSKGSSSNSGSSRSKSQAAGNSCSSSRTTTTTTDNMLVRHLAPPPPPQLPFLPPLTRLSNYGGGDIRLGFGGIHPDIDHWRLQQQEVQQFPNFMAGLDQPGGMYYPLEGDQGAGAELPDYVERAVAQFGTKPLDLEIAMVKMEENNHLGLNLSWNFLGVNGGSDQYWGGNAWSADLPGFNSSSTAPLL